VRAPAIEWPSTFQEVGPAGDPSILLLGDVRIAGTNYVITAIRMGEGLTEPDFRDDIDRDEYEAVLDDFLDDAELLTDSRDSALLALENGKYLLWMIPITLN
jgi:hypothetical protein